MNSCGSGQEEHDYNLAKLLSACNEDNLQLNHQMTVF